jgi:hypothetical protein
MSSSIHIQKASGGSVHHNSRENFSHSVVFTDEKNEVWNNAKDSFTIYRDELKIRSEAYSNSTGQKLQSRAVTQLSAVLNLEQHHTMKDLEPIKKYLEKEFDTKVYQMAIHRDEGKLKENSTGNYLVSGTDFFLNPKDNNLYYDKKYTKPLNLENYTIEKNYHAHIEMMGLKSNGKAIRQDMNKFKLSKLQDFVAESLQMERGKNYRIEKSSKRLDTHEFKKAKKIENNVLKSAKEHIKTKTVSLAKAKELQAEIKQLREELKETGATRADYAALEKTNKDLKAEIKNKTLTVDQLQQEIKELKTNLIGKDKVITKQNEAVNSSQMILKVKEKEINTLKTQINSLEAQKEVLPSKDINLSEKSDSHPIMKQIEAYNQIEEVLNKQIEKKEVKTGLMKSEEVEIIPDKPKLFTKIKSIVKDSYDYLAKHYTALQEKYNALATKYNNLLKENKDIKIENLELKHKVRELQLNTTLSHTGKDKAPGTEKKSNAMDLIKEMQSRSISKEDISKMSQELRKEINKNKGQELER